VSQILGVSLAPGDGCMIPIPQYPLYTATLSYVHAKPLPYYLQETEQWSMNHDVLVSAVSAAKAAGTKIKALVIINPGNPTGSCLSVEAMQAVIQLCYNEGILLLADEVYQANIFDPQHKPFVSFKKVLRDMPNPIRDAVELVSFHSISKGVSGECGRRGGYFEAVNISADVMEQIYKMASVSLCPPVTGQVSRVEFLAGRRAADQISSMTSTLPPRTYNTIIDRSSFSRRHSTSARFSTSSPPPPLPSPCLRLIQLCPLASPLPAPSQIGVDLLVSPPQPGSASYDQYTLETSTTHLHLRDRSLYMAERFNALPRMSCQPAEGAMYLFPRIEMPQKAIQAAKEKGKEADVMYALDLLGESDSGLGLGVGIGVVSRLYRGEEDGGARGVSYESSGATGAG
jgi:aspartate/methionine/tyrosine aminotransferase